MSSGAESKGQDTEQLNREEGSTEVEGEFNKPEGSRLGDTKGLRSSPGNNPKIDQKQAGNGEKRQCEYPGSTWVRALSEESLRTVRKGARGRHSRAPGF